VELVEKLSVNTPTVCFSLGGLLTALGSVVVKGFRAQRNVKMLVLSRKKNESIVINDDITIVVVEIRGDKVRLGVEAPKEVPVHRREVYDAIKRTVESPADSAGVDSKDPV
jgi:carbon storage regulator